LKGRIRGLYLHARTKGFCGRNSRKNGNRTRKKQPSQKESGKEKRPLSRYHPAGRGKKTILNMAEKTFFNDGKTGYEGGEKNHTYSRQPGKEKIECFLEL